jgi:hypothetical protein
MARISTLRQLLSGGAGGRVPGCKMVQGIYAL